MNFHDFSELKRALIPTQLLETTTLYQQVVGLIHGAMENVGFLNQLWVQSQDQMASSKQMKQPSVFSCSPKIPFIIACKLGVMKKNDRRAKVVAKPYPGCRVATLSYQPQDVDLATITAMVILTFRKYVVVENLGHYHVGHMSSNAQVF